MKCKSAVLLVLSITLVGSLVVGKSFQKSVLEDYTPSKNYFRSNARAEMSAGSYQNLSVTGDIIVEDGTYLIENMELHLVGKIVARNNASVIVRNAKLAVTTQGDTNHRDRVLLLNRSRFVAENASIILKSPDALEPSYITSENEALVNMTHSELHGYVVIVGRQDSVIYLNNSSFKDPRPSEYGDSGVGTSDNSTASVDDSELGIVAAWDNSSIYVRKSIVKPGGVHEGGGASIEIEDSDVGFSDFLVDNCTLRMTNCTASGINFRGSVLRVEDSRLKRDVRVYGNSTAWLKRTSADGVQAYDSSQVWFINSGARRIDTFDDGKVYVGWELPLFGIVSVPHSWLPILQGLGLLLVLSLIVALSVFLSRRWRQSRLKKAKQADESSGANHFGGQQVGGRQ